ncbi:MAG: hypothetical protein ABR595_08910, partial [Psychroflexus sp.]
MLNDYLINEFEINEGSSTYFNLSINENETIDLGITGATFTTDVEGHLYEDINGNGIQDSGEPDLSDVPVAITDFQGNTQTVNTGADGNWVANVIYGEITVD